jgi:hypothetical protein
VGCECDPWSCRPNCPSGEAGGSGVIALLLDPLAPPGGRSEREARAETDPNCILGFGLEATGIGIGSRRRI